MTRSHKKRLFFGLAFVLLIVLLRYFDVGRYITIASIKEDRRWLQGLVEQNYWHFLLSFLGIYIGATALSLPLSVPLSLAAGFFFGTFWGAIYANIGATIGSTISFLLIRHLFGKVFQERYKERLVAFNREFKRNGYSYLLMLHVVMVIPLFVPNILAGLAHVSLFTFVWTTAVGMIPGTFTFAFTGKQLMSINSIHEVFSVKMLIPIVLMLLLALSPLIIQKLRRHWHKRDINLEV